VRLPWRRREEPSYPPYVTTAAERERWNLAEGLARRMFGDGSPYDVGHATRSIYRSEIPTRTADDLSPPEPD
jgi:hypothetical protein